MNVFKEYKEAAASNPPWGRHSRNSLIEEEDLCFHGIHNWVCRHGYSFWCPSDRCSRCGKSYERNKK